jgi:hypothetical protein
MIEVGRLPDPAKVAAKEGATETEARGGNGDDGCDVGRDSRNDGSDLTHHHVDAEKRPRFNRPARRARLTASLARTAPDRKAQPTQKGRKPD